ncbi:MAG: hypothetical protein OWU84_11410 [Firmicutes bacterium]|nr:hypothetical protein [Bacillota bacterium]
MRRMLWADSVGTCQVCGELLTSRDILETGQARLCSTCLEAQATHRASLLNAVQDAARQTDRYWGASSL